MNVKYKNEQSRRKQRREQYAGLGSVRYTQGHRKTEGSK